jgi:membrane protein DedA with SNARE-associated domain
VVVVGWVGATVGGVGGWLVGRKIGRTALSAPGPMRGARIRALARGDRFFARYGTLAVFFTPSWVAGIHDMPATRYFTANAAAALVWALSLGVGSYLLGPTVGDIVSDFGLVGVVAGAVVAVGLVVGRLERRRRRRRQGPHRDDRGRHP